jgi:hypothetical protein
LIERFTGVHAGFEKLLGRGAAGVLRVLPTHGPRAIGETFGFGLDGIELVVM